MENLAPYVDILRGIQGIHDVKLVQARGKDARHDAVATLRTAAGRFQMPVRAYTSHLARGTVEHLVAGATPKRRPLLVFAPHIGSGIGAALAGAGINYLDRHGNCHVAIGAFHVHIEGRTRPAHHAADKGLRSPGYQVLFTYLAAPHLLDAPVRAVAEAAGVSRQPVSDVRARLLEEEYVLETRAGRCRWVEHRRDDALNLWLHGYDTAVRTSLVWASYRVQTSDPDEVERRIETALDVPEFRWGGTAAGFRLTHHYRGERTTVHVHSTPPDLQKKLRAMTDPAGNLVFLDAFGDINWHWKEDAETVHPLLVYSEMRRERDERAREAAERLLEEILQPMWDRGA